MAGNQIHFILFLILTLLNRCLSGQGIVKTNTGRVSGQEVNSIIKNDTFIAFLGIPYAEPPVGKLRFMPPEPHGGWDDVLEATKPQKHCAQFNLPSPTNKQAGFAGDEDCLYLNIYTPNQQEQSKRAVIVFLQNDQFRISYNISKDYGPDFFIKEDVIIVSISHRLGSLGFLSFEDDLVPGNNGLRDVILALNWIKDNISSFGGDPEKVTLMGSISGGALVNILLHSPKAKGLFRNVILQSGTYWDTSLFSKDPRKKALALTKELEFDETVTSHLLERLSSVTADVLTENEIRSLDSDESRLAQRGVFQFGPVIEHDHPNAVITEIPENNLNVDVPIMIGYNSREGLHYAARYLNKPQFLTFADRDFLVMFPRRVNYSFDISSHVFFEAIQEIKDYYFEEGYVKTKKPSEYVTYLGDIVRVYPIDYAVRSYTNNTQNTVYFYMFDYSGDLNFYKKQVMENAVDAEGSWGASEKDELCYLFVCNQIRNLYKNALADESEEIAVLRNMVRMWSNFAKHGNPTPNKEDFVWIPATHDNKECLVISDELEMKSNLQKEIVEFWDDFISRYEDMAINGTIKDSDTDLKDEL